MSYFTKNYKAGDVISVAFFPNEENKKQGEPRWVICLEDLGDKFVAVPLKSDTSDIKHHPKSFIIKQDSEEGISMNLLNDSLVMPDRATNMNKIFVLKEGNCSEGLIDKLHELVK
ncbi:MAG: hypothetical protein Q7T72_02950 [Bacteroidales bacterium]|nr:hypothetical protein [Bacteroidales bacterium]